MRVHQGSIRGAGLWTDMAMHALGSTSEPFTPEQLFFVVEPRNVLLFLQQPYPKEAMFLLYVGDGRIPKEEKRHSSDPFTLQPQQPNSKHRI